MNEEELRNPEEIEQLRREKEILEKQGFEFDGHSWVEKIREESLRKEFDKRVKTLKLDEQAKEELFNKFKLCYENGFTCYYCKERMELEFENELSFTIDHYLAKSKSGLDIPNNLVFCCRTCNFLKGDKDVEWFVHNVKRLKLRKKKNEYWEARKASKKDEGTREAYKDIFKMVDVKKEMGK